MIHAPYKKAEEQVNQISSLPATGERFLPQNMTGDVALEHLHRYGLACEMAAGKVVLDIASGEGYGSHLLAQVANAVIGVDVSSDAIAYAKQNYSCDNLEFRLGSCASIPVADQSIDLAISFETIEHHDQHEEMLAELKRVLKPDGILFISTPDKLYYSDLSGRKNEFHVKELYFEEFRALLERHFQYHEFHGQMVHYGSLVMPIGKNPDQFHTFHGNASAIAKVTGIEHPLYFLAVASNSKLPTILPSIFDGTDALITLLGQTDRTLSETRDRLDEATFKLDEATLKLDTIYNSIFWRITFPLRLLRRYLIKNY